MLVSHLKKFIYIKSVKTASTSIERYFEKYCLPLTIDVPLVGDAHLSEEGIIGKRGTLTDDDRTAGKWYNHMPAARIKEQIGDAVWEPYYKFGTVRNPFDKAVSYFYMYKSQRSLPISAPALEQKEFENWLVGGGYRSDFDIYSLNGVCCLDDYIRYEFLYPDLHRLCKKLDVPFVPQLTSYNSTHRPAELNSLTLYTEVSKQVINDICATELTTFGYSFPTTAFKVNVRNIPQ